MRRRLGAKDELDSTDCRDGKVVQGRDRVPW